MAQPVKFKQSLNHGPNSICILFLIYCYNRKLSFAIPDRDEDTIMRLKKLAPVLFLLLMLPLSASHAQENLAAVLEVLTAGVEVQAEGTANWLPIRSETIINVGDRIRTDDQGQARITFFADGTAIELDPASEVIIQEFAGNDQRFNLSLEVVGGIVKQQVNALTDDASTYEVITPGMSMAVRGTDFWVRVEDDGRSALLTRTGNVAASDEGDESPVAAGFGVRSGTDESLSDVVAATSFDELDAALDGCSAQASTNADVRLYVRLGPSRDLAQVGSIDPSVVVEIRGRTSDEEWYRIPYRDGFGWVNTTNVTFTIGTDCASVREYDDVPVEDASLYSSFEISGDALVLIAESNFRTGPGLSYPATRSLAVGSVVSITGKDETGQWVQVITEDGESGWMYRDLLRLYIDPNGLDVIVNPNTTQTPAPTEASAEATAESSQ